MKPYKIILSFVIIYFITTSLSSVVLLAQSISAGNKYIEYGFYLMIIVLILLFIIFPIIQYSFKPSVNTLSSIGDRDPAAIKKYRNHLLNTLDEQKKSELKNISAKNLEDNVTWMVSYLDEAAIKNRKIVRNTAIKLTTTVIISPNSFIDGLAILIGNSHMIYELSKNMGVRYSWKDIINFYFNTLTIASISGIIQSFDEEIEEVIESIAEEFAEFLGAESGRSISEVVPLANILSKAMVPIFEAASNYAYTIYNGNRFLTTLINQLDESPLDQGQINKASRKLARKEKYKYLAEMAAKISINGPKSVFKKVFNNKKNKI